MRKFLLVLGIFSLFLAGCREETDLYFYTNQKWKVESALTVDQAILDLFIGVGGMVVGSELGVPIPDSMLESENWIGLSLDWIVTEYQNQGLDARWRKNSNTYTLTVKGEQFAVLSGVSTGLITLVPVLGTDGQYHLQMETLDLGDMDSELSTFGLGYERVITLHAGRIVQSNADEVRGGTAIWHNPSLAEAVFEPSNPFPLQILFTFLCFGSIIETITLASRRFSGNSCPTCGRRVRKGQEICSNCGGYVGISMDNP